MEQGATNFDPGTPGPAPDERQLVERARTDSAAFAALYRCHYPCIVGCLYRRIGDTHIAEDLAADTFLSAMKALPGYRVTDVPFRIWLLRIATNAANRWARQRLKLKLGRVAFTPLASGAAGERQAAMEEAQAAMLALAPAFQSVLSLHYLESLSLDEVATVLGCRIGTVKSRLARARAAMKAELERRRNEHG
jgi:RNA polymerase sigma-70 factor (ECF subfamily)